MTVQSRMVRIGWKWVLPLVGLAALVLAVYFSLRPTRTHNYHLSLTAGNELGLRHRLAEGLRGEVEARRITLDLRPSLGSEQALDWVNRREVDIALVEEPEPVRSARCPPGSHPAHLSRCTCWSSQGCSPTARRTSRPCGHLEAEGLRGSEVTPRGPRETSHDEGHDVGTEVGGATVDFADELTFKFTGKIEKVRIDLKLK